LEYVCLLKNYYKTEQQDANWIGRKKDGPDT
jgi:hypothetical protein